MIVGDDYYSQETPSRIFSRLPSRTAGKDLTAVFAASSTFCGENMRFTEDTAYDVFFENVVGEGEDEE